jgi:RNA polymerase sigma-70 factor (ECF subfamily)
LQVEKEYRERVLRDVQPEQLITDEGEEQFFPDEIYRRLLTMIDLLPTRQREVFLMHMDGARNKEIAEKLNISVNTVKIQKKRALATLRQKLNEQQLLLLMLLIV